MAAIMRGSVGARSEHADGGEVERVPVRYGGGVPRRGGREVHCAAIDVSDHPEPGEEQERQAVVRGAGRHAEDAVGPEGGGASHQPVPVPRGDDAAREGGEGDRGVQEGNSVVGSLCDWHAHSHRQREQGTGALGPVAWRRTT